MATGNGGVCSSEKRRKKKNLNNCPKLLVGEKVEVRSVEKGYEGFWHPGTVIACEDQARRVQYDHLICIGGTNTLIRSIKVPPITDGIISATKTRSRYRGCTSIRPLPPPINFDENSLHYGQCVDAYRDEAWWEGVIFDNKDGSENRLVYFPDTGNEMHCTRNNLRLAQHWNNLSGKWIPRKNWFFLDLIEEFKQECPLQVSVKQLWSEVKEKEGFRKQLKRWISTGYSLWRSLVWEAFSDNFKLFVEHFFKEQNLLGDKPCKSPLLFSETLFDDILKPKPHLSSHVNEKRKHMWLPACSDIVPEFCPDSVMEFIHMYNCKERPSVQLRQNLRKHLLFLGWKIEFMKVKEVLVFKYTSPEGKSYGTLLQACENLKAETSYLNPEPKTEEFSCNGSKFSPKKEHKKRKQTWGPADPHFVPEAEFCPDAIREFKLNMETKRKPSNSLALNVRKHLSFLGWKIEFKRYNGAPKLRYTSPDGTSFVSLPKVLHNLSESSDTCSVTNQNKAKFSPDISIEKHPSPSPNKPECFPEAIKQYYLLGSVKNANGTTFQDPENKEVKMKAKKHLAALGWSFSYYTRASGKRELHYTSKSGKRYASLRAACKGCVDEEVVFERKTVDEDEQPIAQLILKSKSIKVEVEDIAEVRKRGKKRMNKAKSLDSHLLHLKHKIVEAKHMKKRKKNTSFIDIQSVGGDCTESALRSCKRSRKGVETTLFRLIDNNLVSPRGEVYNVSKEDKCQIGEKSDYVCSICRYGGELILCDECPSAFHIKCLGLQCVPDGEWFCPSCCCGTCGDGRFSCDTKEFGDESVLSCDQCEHKYHVGCLRLKGILKLENSHKENWFCSERCEQIFLGLQKLLGTPVLVGEKNITWTLLKYTESSGCDQNILDKEALAENYSKLCVALSVMHECFEPSIERKTRRDVLEDVIFSRWSELNRLNFQGFYAVLLEKNGEITTVATVRVHGEKVAEVPLIGTRVKYRRLGMCRMLMNELEKKLTELGVERLVLPAVPSVLNTWTESFQFSKMAELERLNFLDYIFLDFEGTAMCQKFLRETSSSCSDHLEPKETALVLSENNGLDEKGVSSEIFQADLKFSIQEVDLACPVHESESVLFKHEANPEDKVETADQGSAELSTHPL